MPITFLAADQALPEVDARQHVVVIAHSVPALQGIAPDGCVARLTSPQALPFIVQAAGLLSPSLERGASTDLLVPGNGASLQRVSLCVLPTGGSRHNAPGRPHAVSDLLKGAKSAGRTVAVLLLASPEHAFSAACAASRVFPLYTRKNGAEGMAADRDHVVVVDAPAEAVGPALEDATVCADGIRLCQRLVDAPCSDMHTDAMVAEARAVAERTGAMIRVIRGEELREGGFGGLYGVGKASAHPPALVVLSLYPDGVDQASPSVCLCGKGVVYDTGGLSIKTKTGMPGMKRDMGGSAGVLGAFEALCQRGGCPRVVHALLCLAENSVDMHATRPDDIHTMLSGLTTEINNTDAEGRLCLGDGVAYAARELQPGIIITMATLTGAQGISTGKRHAALYCSDEAVETSTLAAGRFTGDLCHALPYCPEFFKPEFASKVADMKNSVADRSNAQSSCAGQFIANHCEGFINAGKPFLHIDMASPSYIAERATGFGVALLYALVRGGL